MYGYVSSEFTLVELVGYEDIEARSYEALASLVVHYTYNNLHQYSHNKITCPCPLCKPKNFGIDTKDKFSIRRKKKAGEDALREYQTGEVSYNYEAEEEVVL